MRQLYLLWSIIRKYETILASIFIILTVVILTLKLLVPNFSKANQIFLQYEDLANKQKRLEAKNKLLTSLDENYYRTVYVNFDGVLPKTKDYVTLFSTFDNLQSKSGVTILSTEFQLGSISTESAALKDTKKSIAYQLPMVVDAIGTEGQFKNFMTVLTDLSGRIITVESSQWKPAEGGYVQVNLKGYAYFYPQTTTIRAVDQDLPKIDSENELILSQIHSNTIVSKDINIDERSVTVGKRNLFE